VRVVLISTYELGHQPFGVASSAAWLRAAGASVLCWDAAIEPPDNDTLAHADLLAFCVPMHTATRLAAELARHAKQVNPHAHLCFFGLYAPVNEQFLRDLGAETILGGEFEDGLRSLVARLASSPPAMHRADGASQTEPVISLARQQFLVPDRSTLPALDRYAYLSTADGQRRTVGYTEATRGCKHVCRHCPIVPVYQGRFRVVQRDVVLADIANQVTAGAQHITFGDPDFLNAPTHALAVVEALHESFPQLSYDVTVKVEHLIKHANLLARLHNTGCILITTAVESFDERILEIFDKRHTREDVVRVVRLLREEGIGLNPTFVAFTPWTTRRGYLDFLDTLAELDLIDNVSTVQYAIRLLIPRGSALLALPEVRALVGDEFDPDALSYRWHHPDPGVDDLFAQVDAAVRAALCKQWSKAEIFTHIRGLACDGLPDVAHDPTEIMQRATRRRHSPVPSLSEPWYCCAEPTAEQFAHF
jgi:radical SAM superfamily enzyme YgiQ (UPF0313 family)